MKKKNIGMMLVAILSSFGVHAYTFKVINLAPDKFGKAMSAWAVEDKTGKSLVAALLPFGAESMIDVPSAKVKKIVAAKAGNLFTQANKPVFLNTNLTVDERTNHVLTHGAMASNTLVFANDKTGIPASLTVISPIPASGAELAIVPRVGMISGEFINDLPMTVIKKSEIVSYFTDWATKMNQLYNKIPVLYMNKPIWVSVQDYANQVKNYLASIGIKTTAFDALLKSASDWLAGWERKEKAVQQALAQSRLSGGTKSEMQVRQEMRF